MLWKQIYPAEMIKGARDPSWQNTLSSFFQSSTHSMDRLWEEEERKKNFSAMLDPDQHSHTIIINLMIAHQCLCGMLSVLFVDDGKCCMEQPAFSRLSKRLLSEKATVLSSRVIIYLSKQGSSQREQEAPWAHNCTAVSPEMPQVKMKRRPFSRALCLLAFKK